MNTMSASNFITLMENSGTILDLFEETKAKNVDCECSMSGSFHWDLHGNTWAEGNIANNIVWVKGIDIVEDDNGNIVRKPYVITGHQFN